MINSKNHDFPWRYLIADFCKSKVLFFEDRMKILFPDIDLKQWDKILQLHLYRPWFTLNYKDKNNYSIVKASSKDYIKDIYSDLFSLQNVIKNQGSDIKYIIWFSHFAHHLKRFWFSIYDLDGKYQLIDSLQWLIQTDITSVLLYDIIDLSSYKILKLFSSFCNDKENAIKYMNLSIESLYDYQERKLLLKTYKPSDIKAAIISKEDFLSIDLTK